MKPPSEANDLGFLEDLLREVGGNVSKAAEAAGLHRSTLYEKLTRFGLAEKDEPA